VRITAQDFPNHRDRPHLILLLRCREQKNVDSVPRRAARSRRVRCASRAINTLTLFPLGETAKGSLAKQPSIKNNQLNN
jgi:hypothetical protein